MSEDWNADQGRSGARDREYHSKSYSNSSRDYDKDSSRGQNWRSDDRGGSGRNSGRYSDSMEINRDQIGMVIGRGGSNIKDIQSKFSVYVNVDKNSSQSGTTAVSVSGDSQSSVDDAINHIRDQVENAPQRYDRRRDDRRDDDRRQNQSSGGYGGYDNYR